MSETLLYKERSNQLMIHHRKNVRAARAQSAFRAPCRDVNSLCSFRVDDFTSLHVAFASREIAAQGRCPHTSCDIS